MAEKHAEKHEGKGGKILSMTVKRARRVQEKVPVFVYIQTS